jgi:hypothetical protein
MTTLSSSSSATPSPSPSPDDEDIGSLCATGYGRGPIPWMAQGGSQQPHEESAGSEGSIGQQADGMGEEDGGFGVTLTLGLEICSYAGCDGPAPGFLRFGEAGLDLGRLHVVADGD